MQDKVTLIKEKGVVKGFKINEQVFHADDGRVEVNNKDLKGFNISSIPDGFWLALIEENFVNFFGASTHKDRAVGSVGIEIPFYRDSWYHRFGLSEYVTTMKKAIELRKKTEKDVDYVSIFEEKSQTNLEYTLFFFQDIPIEKAYQKYHENLEEIEGHTERILEGTEISAEIIKDEKGFTLKVLLPLFRHMGFLDVKYNHGRREFGKDIVFSDMDKLGFRRNYGVQVKAGNLSGEAGSEIDKIIAQIKDAFPMSYKDAKNRQERHISHLIIAISGRYTDNAKEKIMQKVHAQNISFLDIDDVQDLLVKYMKKTIK